jgi:hypothetical protein
VRSDIHLLDDCYRKRHQNGMAALDAVSGNTVGALLLGGSRWFGQSKRCLRRFRLYDGFRMPAPWFVNLSPV